MKHVITRIDELVKETDQTKAMWHVLMCIRLSAVDDWKIQQEIVDEAYARMMDKEDDDGDPRYFEGFSDGIDFVLGLIQEKTGLRPIVEE